MVKYTSADFDVFKMMVSDDDTMKYIAGNGWTEAEARNHLTRCLKSILKKKG